MRCRVSVPPVRLEASVDGDDGAETAVTVIGGRCCVSVRLAVSETESVCGLEDSDPSPRNLQSERETGSPFLPD